MKKLMIMAAVMGAAVAAQAITTWEFNLTYNAPIKAGYKATEAGEKSEVTIGAGYNVYIISSKSITEGYFISQGNLLSGLREGKSVGAVAGNALIATTTTTGTGDFESFSQALDEKFYDAQDNVTAYMAIVAGNDVFLSSNTSGDNFVLGFNAGASDIRIDTADNMLGYSGVGWYAISAPEPTSGLLMLLGFAGLALKRRKM